jgi:hypothetical protein
VTDRQPKLAIRQEITAKRATLTRWVLLIRSGHCTKETLKIGLRLTYLDLCDLPAELTDFANLCRCLLILSGVGHV